VAVIEFFRDRARAESFGAVAEAYDRHRPDFPAPLLDDVAALGHDILDIGSGTGKVARALAQRGAAVLGVEPDPAMATVARGHGVVVELARFETWDDAGRRFDVISCGDAWHWLEPVQATACAARVLRPGGTLARFFNMQCLDAPVLEALAGVYRELAPELYLYGTAPELPEDVLFPAPLVGPFTAPERRIYHWPRAVTASEWAALCNTISDHQRLPAERRQALLAAVTDTLAAVGEPIRVHGVTRASFTRRTPT
jgi:SAM-dependent methyltransferase